MNETELEIIACYTDLASIFYLMLLDEERQNGINTPRYKELLKMIGGQLQNADVLFSNMGKDYTTFLYSILGLKMLFEFASSSQQEIAIPTEISLPRGNAISTAIEISKILDLKINRIIDRVSFYSHSLDEGILKFLTEIGTLDFVPKTTEENLLMQSITKDITKAFLYFNQTEEHLFDGKTKDLWARVKYNLAFISIEAENFLLSERGPLPDKISFKFSSVGEKSGMTKERIADIQELVGRKACQEAISNLMQPNLSDPKRTLYNNYLKSGLAVLLSHSNYEEITNSFKEDVYSQLDNNQENDSMSFSHIVSTIDDFKKNNSKCKVLEFPK